MASEPTISIRSCSKNEFIFIGEEINEHTANIIVAQLLHLAYEDPKKISHSISIAPAGISDGLAIYDTMNFIAPDVATYGLGCRRAWGAFLLSSGARASAMCYRMLG